jgi:hypothetical protein
MNSTVTSLSYECGVSLTGVEIKIEIGYAVVLSPTYLIAAGDDANAGWMATFLLAWGRTGFKKQAERDSCSL